MGTSISDGEWIQFITDAGRSGEPLDPSECSDLGPLTSEAPAQVRPHIIPAHAFRAAIIALTGDGETVDPHGVTIRDAEFEGVLDLAWMTVPFPLAFVGCVFTEQIQARYSHLAELSLSHCSCAAISIDGAQIDGSLLCADLAARGKFSAIGARIGGRLELERARLSNPAGDALVLDGAQVGSDAFCHDLTATGVVRAISARFGGQLHLKRARLSNPAGDALVLDGAHVGSAFWQDLTATGAVRALAARIDGQLILAGATLTNPAGMALALDLAQIGGGAFWPNLTASGEVRAVGARISGELRLHGARLSGLNLERAQLRRVKIDDTRTEGGVILEEAHIDVLEASGRLPTPLRATGWAVGRVQGAISDDWRVGRDWLDTAEEFTSQPWQELAATFDRAGEPAQARRLRSHAAKRTTRHAPWYAKPPRWLYGATVGHGYYPLRAALWIVAVAFVASMLAASQPQMFGPTDATKAAPEVTAQSDPSPVLPTGATPCSKLRLGYPCFEPLLYAVGVAVPIAATQDPAWRPIDSRAVAAIGTLRVFGWVLTALLLAGFTNLLRRT